jgi:hypothetical protein
MKRDIIRHLCGRIAYDKEGGFFIIKDDGNENVSDVLLNVGGPFKNRVGRLVRVTIEAMEVVPET